MICIPKLLSLSLCFSLSYDKSVVAYPKVTWKWQRRRSPHCQRFCWLLRGCMPHAASNTGTGRHTAGTWWSCCSRHTALCWGTKQLINMSTRTSADPDTWGVAYLVFPPAPSPPPPTLHTVNSTIAASAVLLQALQLHFWIKWLWFTLLCSTILFFCHCKLLSYSLGGGGGGEEEKLLKLLTKKIPLVPSLLKMDFKKSVLKKEKKKIKEAKRKTRQKEPEQKQKQKKITSMTTGQPFVWSLCHTTPAHRKLTLTYLAMFVSMMVKP